jgi:integrase
VTVEGEPVTYWGLFSIFRRLKARSGVPRLRALLFRHGFARAALQNNAERAAVMDMLGHATDKMARRCAGAVRQEAEDVHAPAFAARTQSGCRRRA